MVHVFVHMLHQSEIHQYQNGTLKAALYTYSPESPTRFMLGGSRHLDVYSLGLSSLVWARQISNFRNQFVIFEGYWFQYTDTVWVTFSSSQNISGDVGKLPRAEDVALFSQPQLHPAHKKHNQRHHQRAPLDATTAGTAHDEDDLIWWSALADTPPHDHAS